MRVFAASVLLFGFVLLFFFNTKRGPNPDYTRGWSTTKNREEVSVAVIGAGPSGIVAARYLKDQYRVSVFEKEEKLGGCWNIDFQYPELTLQSHKDAYAYTDYAFADHVPNFPTHQDVYDYLYNYARNNDVLSLTSFNTEVTALEQGLEGGWHVTTTNLGTNETVTRFYDFVVVANGVFNKLYTPPVPGLENFKGKIYHSHHFTSLDLVHGKNVVVVGAGKSGTHVATMIKRKLKDQGVQVSIVFRSPRRVVPADFLGFIPFQYFFFQPYRSLLRPQDSLEGPEAIIHFLTRPLDWLIGNVVKQISAWQIRRFETFKPPNSNGCGSQLEPMYWSEIDEMPVYPGTRIAEAFEDHLVLTDGSKVPADTIIFATGYTQSLDFLNASLQEQVLEEDAQIWLYKQILHPKLPDIAFVSHTTGMNSVLNSEMASNWILHYLNGKVKIPEPEEMTRLVKENKDYFRKFKYLNSAQSSCVTPSDYWWQRDLLSDMNLRKKLKWGNWLVEYLVSVRSVDFLAENLEPVQ